MNNIIQLQDKIFIIGNEYYYKWLSYVVVGDSLRILYNGNKVITRPFSEFGDFQSIEELTNYIDNLKIEASKYINLPFYKSISVNEGIINNTGAIFNIDNLPFDIPEAGKYQVGLSYVWSYDSTTGDIQVVSELTKQDNTVVEVLSHREEPQDAGGIGVDLPTTLLGVNDNTGTDQKRPSTFVFNFDLVEGTHSLSFDFRGTQAGAEATIYKYNLWVKRVG